MRQVDITCLERRQSTSRTVKLGWSRAPIGVYIERAGAIHTAIDSLPRGVNLGARVSERVPCEHWLYVLEGTNGLVKMGSTHQPEARIRNHARSWQWRKGLDRFACRAIWSLGALTRGQAVRIEYAIHFNISRSFRRATARSEWYIAPLSEVTAIVDAYMAHLATDELVGLS
jgi:predicted GIY-YIG superfamily endonuclease